METNQCLLVGDRAGDVLDCWRSKSCPGVERGERGGVDTVEGVGSGIGVG